MKFRLTWLLFLFSARNWSFLARQLPRPGADRPLSGVLGAARRDEHLTGVVSGMSAFLVTNRLEEGPYYEPETDSREAYC